MSTSTCSFHDGFYGTAKFISEAAPEYPFAALGDVTTKTYVSTYRILPGNWVATARGTVDPRHGGCYLIDEKKPAGAVADNGSQEFTRTYSNVPATQTDSRRSVMVSLPSISGTLPKVFGGYRIFQPDTTLLVYDAYVAQTVSSDTGAPAFYPTGGTYTLSFGGNTTGALNYNDSAGTVQTALNALTSVTNRGGLVVTGTYNSAGGFVVTWNSYTTATYDVSGLGFSGGYSTNVYSLNSGYSQNVRFSAAAISGTFTLTLFGSTTAAIAYNASAATVQSAINALAAVSNRGNVVVTSAFSPSTIYGSSVYGAGTIDFTIQFSNAAITGAAGSLTPGSCTITGAVTDGIGVLQTVKFAAPTAVRTLYVPGAGHGLATSDTLYIKGGSTYYGTLAGNFTLPDANTVAITVAASAAYAAASTITEVGKRTKANYTPGSKPVPCDIVTRFSLTTITPDTYQGDGDPLLQAIFSGSTAINYRVGDSTPWPNEQSAIRSLATTKISAANV